MVREFSISAGGQTLNLGSGIGSVIGVNPAAGPDFNLEFLRYWLGQSGSPTSAQQRVQILSAASAWPSMTGATPTSLKLADPNASIIGSATATSQCIVAKAGINSFKEGAGAVSILWDDAFNVLNGWLMVPTPPETRIFPAGYTSMFELYLPSSPGSTSGWAFGTVYREV